MLSIKVLAQRLVFIFLCLDLTSKSILCCCILSLLSLHIVCAVRFCWCIALPYYPLFFQDQALAGQIDCRYWGMYDVFPFLAFLFRGWVERERERMKISHGVRQETKWFAQFLTDFLLILLFPSQAGQKWGRVYDKFVGTGRNVVGGRVSTVGVGGLLTYGGGYSYLSNQWAGLSLFRFSYPFALTIDLTHASRLLNVISLCLTTSTSRFGLAVDLIQEYTLVLPSGTVKRVTAQSDNALFNALKGTGNNVGAKTWTMRYAEWASTDNPSYIFPFVLI